MRKWTSNRSISADDSPVKGWPKFGPALQPRSHYGFGLLPEFGEFGVGLGVLLESGLLVALPLLVPPGPVPVPPVPLVPAPLLSGVAGLAWLPLVLVSELGLVLLEPFMLSELVP